MRRAAFVPFFMTAGAMGAAAGQSEAIHRDTVYRPIVGRHETAQVWIDFDPQSESALRSWDPGGAATHPGGGSPVHLRSLLSVQFGATVVPPGEYQLWTVFNRGAPLLVLTVSHAASDTVFSTGNEVARAPLTVEQLDHRVKGLQVTIRIDRIGPDTIGTIDRSTSARSLREVEIKPGSRATLMIIAGNAVMSLPLAAR